MIQRQYEWCWRASGLTVHRQLFTDQRTLVNNMNEQAKATYYTNVIDDCLRNQKALFYVVKDLLGTKKKPIYPSGSRNQELCEQFSDYFVTRINTICFFVFVFTIREWLDAHREITDEKRDDQESCTSVLPGFDVLTDVWCTTRINSGPITFYSILDTNWCDLHRESSVILSICWWLTNVHNSQNKWNKDGHRGTSKQVRVLHCRDLCLGGEKLAQVNRWKDRTFIVCIFSTAKQGFGVTSWICGIFAVTLM